MSLDPHVKRFLGMMAAAGPSRTALMSPADLREAMMKVARAVDIRGVAVERTEDLAMPGPGGALPLRLYVPHADDGGAGSPGLIYFHGGGGVFGSVETHDGLCRMLADAGGCRVVAVEYRLAPEHRFPAAIEDGCAALRWVAGHAGDLGIDCRRLAIGGDSAGGTIAAVICREIRDHGGPPIALQLLLCPVTDLNRATESRRIYADGYFLDGAMLDWVARHYCPPGADLDDPRLSPLRAADFAGLPPAHIHTAEFDPLRDEGAAYAERLRQAGVDVRYICHPGMIHHFYGIAGAVPYARGAIRDAGMAVRQALGPASGEQARRPGSEERP